MMDLRPSGVCAGRAGFKKSFSESETGRRTLNCEFPVTYPRKILQIEAGPLAWSKPRAA